ncbi:5-oxoprolinase subunit PxpB [Oceanobacillus polygoni]|uniref:Inhibitor of KinA n=1 Tax=Oceanobacillus polygoni TaxID=1235259 RepID=A0A9X0YQQ7_9BACI|nr:5-oxoprolinase subunit PxpB [Oceanobacillus polygoni]MBP2077160.1 inhibitor of KinA [Oceanobacillus polygoni]
MFQISAYGDTGLRIQFGEHISKETNQQIRSFCMLLEKEKIPGVIEWIPTYTAVTIVYDPCTVLYKALIIQMEKLQNRLSAMELPPAEIMHIPVCYGGEKGPDLATVANLHNLDESQVVSTHSSAEYLIYMMGFIPGFAYLGGMSEEIATPRLESPRSAIPAGSVGIAGEQTGIYPLESPGGWQIIGRTPIKLYDPNSLSPILLRAGNYIRFIPISEEEYEVIKQEVDEGTYIPYVEAFEE